MKKALLFLTVAALGAAGGWYFARNGSGLEIGGKTKPDGERKILFYQSAMHPWIKSDKPGNCTICGMKLSPVFEGGQGGAGADGFVQLGSNSISVLHVQTEVVGTRVLRRSIRASGTIDDDDSKHRFISAYVEGRIDVLHVNFTGAEVEEGAPLADFYSPMLLTAEQEYLSLLRAANVAGPLLETARLRLHRLGLTAGQIEALARKQSSAAQTQITAPAGGTVVKRMVYAGQYVKEGDPLFELADFSIMWLMLNIYEQDLSWVRVGQKVAVTTPARPGETFEGTITFIDPNLDEMTRSARARVELPNPLVERDGRKQRLLLHRLYAEARITVETPPVLAAARGAILNPGGTPVVYVDHGEGAYERRVVRTGRRGDDGWEILEGLSEGERIVTSGNLMVDAQAELNSGPSEPPHDHGVASAAAPPSLAPPDRAAGLELFQAAGGLSEALAADDFVGAQKSAARFGEALAVARQKLTDGPWRKMAEALPADALLAARDLPGARSAFQPLGAGLAEFARAFNRAAGTKAARVFKCPMYPKPGQSGWWVQMGLPLRNPYYGAEMLDCGQEVDP